MWNPEGIIVHCSATPKTWMADSTADQKRDEIKRWHVEERGWRDIGYALIIDRDGRTATGRDTNNNGDPFDDIGAHTSGWNSKSIGVCLIGGGASSATDDFAENFTRPQDEMLRAVIADLKSRFPSIKWVKGHNEFAATACPGFQVGPWLNGKAPRKFVASSTTMQATAATGVAGVTAAGSAIGSLDGTAQIVLLVCVFVMIAGLAWIARERIKKWARGVR